MFRMQVEHEVKQQRVYYSSEVLDLKRKVEVLGNHGAYKDAKLVRKHMKNQQKVERINQTE